MSFTRQGKDCNRGQMPSRGGRLGVIDCRGGMVRGRRRLTEIMIHEHLVNSNFSFFVHW